MKNTASFLKYSFKAIWLIRSELYVHRLHRSLFLGLIAAKDFFKNLCFLLVIHFNTTSAANTTLLPPATSRRRCTTTPIRRTTNPQTSTTCSSSSAIQAIQRATNVQWTSAAKIVAAEPIRPNPTTQHNGIASAKATTDAATVHCHRPPNSTATRVPTPACIANAACKQSIAVPTSWSCTATSPSSTA